MSYQAAVITVSDRASAGVYEDNSGPAVAAMLKEAGYEVVYTSIVPDEQEKISEELNSCVDEKHCDLVITSGGTGLSPRDVTHEATRAVLERASADGALALEDPRTMARYLLVAMHGLAVVGRTGVSKRVMRKVVRQILAPLDAA